MITANISESIAYVQRKPAEMDRAWDRRFPCDPKSPSPIIKEAFPVDPKNKRTRQTALRWAGLKNPTITEFLNVPIDAVKIIGLDVRTEGGRAWKVLIDDMFCVDLREDVLLEALKNGKGVSEGILQGPFQWCSVVSQMKLVRIGSALHREVLEACGRTKEKDIPESKFEVGVTYVDRKKHPWIYLGKVDTTAVTALDASGKPITEHRYGSFTFTLETSELRSVQLWADAKYAHGKGYQEVLKHHPYVHGYLKFLHRKSVVREVRREILPADFLEKLREMTTEEARCHCVSSLSLDNLKLQSAALSQVCFMRKPGEPRPVVKVLSLLDPYLENKW